MEAEHIAPCGMNCALCQAFQGKGIVCPGCGENVTRTSCRKCSIRLCGQKTRFCFTCSQYPCARLKRLDKRYRLKYGMSMLDNLNLLKEQGMQALLAQQRADHTCPRCGRPKTVHQSQCLYCAQKENTP